MAAKSSAFYPSSSMFTEAVGRTPEKTCSNRHPTNSSRFIGRHLCASFDFSPAGTYFVTSQQYRLCLRSSFLARRETLLKAATLTKPHASTTANCWSSLLITCFSECRLTGFACPMPERGVTNYKGDGWRKRPGENQPHASRVQRHLLEETTRRAMGEKLIWATGTGQSPVKRDSGMRPVSAKTYCP